VGAAESIRHHLLFSLPCVYSGPALVPPIPGFYSFFGCFASYDVYLPPPIRCLCPFSQSLSEQPVLIPYLLLPLFSLFHLKHPRSRFTIVLNPPICSLD